jgi:hypothetical protein
MGGRVLLFLMLVALAAAAPRASAQAAPASPAPAAQQARDANAATRAAFEEAERLIDAGRFDEARAALRAMAREDDYARVYGAFVDARLDEATGRLTRARRLSRHSQRPSRACARAPASRAHADAARRP